MRVNIPVRGGTLWLNYPDDVHGQFKFEYEGVIPPEWALELAQGTPDDGFTVNGESVAEWLAGFIARTT